jgi:hypothetical protein
MTDNTTSTHTGHAAAPTGQRATVVARGSAEYRYRRYAVCLLFLGFAAWCFHDGFIKYPRLNAQAIAQGQNPPHGPPHASWDVPFNVTLAFVLPAAAGLLLIWTLRSSRGQFRLEGGTLHVPGHPLVALDSIRRIDKRLWDRKGIAFIEYERPDQTLGRFRLDDFIYQREPIDRILEAIEAHALAMAGSSQAAQPVTDPV